TGSTEHPNGHPVTRAGWPPHHTKEYDMNDHDHEGHGDATLDVIALLEASLKSDEQGYDALLDGAIVSDHLRHVLGTLVGMISEDLLRGYGRDGALEVCAMQRANVLGKAYGPNECDHEEPHVHREPHFRPDQPEVNDDPVMHVAYELSELTEATGKNAD